MRKLSLLFLLTALMAVQASALDTEELLATIAMPLAVAAVADVAGVPSSDLAELVVAMNQANVPATQFVEVIRYTPVALVDPSDEEPFVAYVQERHVEGVRGDALADSMVQRLETRYDIQPERELRAPATTIVVEDNYIPPVVVTRVATYRPVSVDPLALIALPLAVAAVSEISGVPALELANLVATLNHANVAPVQMVEVVRFAPAALVVDGGLPFLQFVRTQTTRGITGPALVPVIATELRTYYPPDTRIAFRPASTEFFENELVPQVVVTRTAEVRAHPHGGPPGQLKKQLGLQTGAEVVHGSAPGTERVARAERKVRAERSVARAEKPDRAPKARASRSERAPKAARAARSERQAKKADRVVASPSPQRERVKVARPAERGNSGAKSGNAKPGKSSGGPGGKSENNGGGKGRGKG
ncbi:MAG TPA: hypothetical protein VF883_21675 [Thermoanaerobaculia bacterium]